MDWDEISYLANRLMDHARPMAADEPELIDQLRKGLYADSNGLSKNWEALVLLRLAEREVVRALIPELLYFSGAHKIAYEIRQILGRLEREVLRQDLLPATEEIIRYDSDEDTVNRTVELLAHLGFDSEIRAWVQPLADSPDGDLRDIYLSYHDYGI